MIIRHLTLENFGPYVGTTDLDFPESGVVVIHGDNGFGKTSILNALNWCLYGVVVDRSGTRVAPERLFNHDARDRGEPRFSVTLEFTHTDPAGDDHSYKLRRIAQADRSKTAKDGRLALEQILEIQIDGAIRHPSQFDDAVNEVLPRGVSRFFLFDGEMIGEYESLLDDNVTGSAGLVKQSIEMVLGVPSAKRGKEDLDTLVSEFDKIYAGQAKKSSKSKAAGKELERLGAEKDRARENLAEAQKLDASSTRRLKEAQEHLATFEQFKDDARVIERVDRDLINLDEQRAAWRERRCEAATRLWQDVINPRVQVRLDQLDQEREHLARAEEAVAAATQALAAVEKSIGDGKCDTCHQPLPKKEMDRFDKLLAKAQEQLEQASDAADPGRLEEVRQASAVLRSIVPAGVASEIIGLETDLKRAVVQEKKLRTEGDAAKERLKGRDPRLIAKYERDEETFRTSKAKASLQIRECTERIAALDVEIAKLRALVKKDHNPEMLRLETALEFLREIADYFTQSVEILIAKMRTAVEQGANEAFTAISNSDLYSGLEINENYGLTLFDKKGRAADMRSAGYEHVVAMSLIASLNKNAAVQAPVVMDTPFGRLDPGHTTGILKYCVAMADQVILLVQAGEVSEADFAEIRPQIALEVDIVHPDATTSTLAVRSII